MKKHPYSFQALFALVLVCVFMAGGHSTAAAAPSGFEDLSEKLLPTVVNIATTTKIDSNAAPDMPQFPPGSPFDQFFKDFYDQYRNAPQRTDKMNALGSGFIIDAEKGYIVTNNHVIKGADEIKVTLHSNETLDAELVGTDEKTDIAVLKVAPHKALVAAAWGDSDQARVGSWIVAIGNPFGLGGTVTAGIISARQRDINSGPYDDYIQTDASINRGNSGGPMFNTDGKVIGVNTAIFSTSGGSIGIGFAIPANMVKSVVAQLVKYGQTKRGWIGVRIQQVTDEIAESLGMDKAQGALVANVTAGGPAEAAGIKAGDVILSFNGHDISEMRKLPRMVAETEIGAKANVTVWRKGKKISQEIILGQLEKAEEQGLLDTGDTPKAEAGGTRVDDLGLSLGALNDSLREKHGVPRTVKGVLVTDVTRNGPAAEKGIAAGDVIVEIDQKEATTPDAVAEAVKAAKKSKQASILLFLARQNDMRFVAVKLKP